MAITMDGIFVNGQKATFRPEDILSGDASAYTEEIGTAVEAWMEQNVTGGEQVTDTTLTLPGVPADAEVTGNKISELKEDLNAIQTATSEDEGKALKVKTVTNGKVTEWEFENTGENAVPFPVSPDSKYGTSGQVLRTKGNGQTEWVTVGQPTDEQTAEAINAWLTEHPVSALDATNAPVGAVPVADGNDNWTWKASANALLLDITAFGGYADGTHPTETEQAINDALTWAKQNGYDKVTFPSGTYAVVGYDPTKADNKAYVDAGIQPPSNIEIELSPDAIIKIATNSKPRYGAFYIKDKQNIYIHGGHIVGDRFTHEYTTEGETHEWGTAIRLTGTVNVILENIEIKDFTGDCISLSCIGFYGDDDYGPATRTKIINCNLHRCRRNGISIAGTEQTLVKGCAIHDVGTTIDGIAGTMPRAGIDVEGYADGTTVTSVPHLVQILDNVFSTNGSADINLFTADTAIVANNHFDGGVACSYAYATVLCNNVFNGDGTNTAITFTSSRQNKDYTNIVNITGNVINNYSVGIQLKGNFNSITGNLIANCAGGILIYDMTGRYVSDALISDNAVFRFTDWAVRFAGGLNITLKGNLIASGTKAFDSYTATHGYISIVGNTIIDITGKLFNPTRIGADHKVLFTNNVIRNIYRSTLSTPLIGIEEDVNIDIIGNTFDDITINAVIGVENKNSFVTGNDGNVYIANNTFHNCVCSNGVVRIACHHACLVKIVSNTFRMGSNNKAIRCTGDVVAGSCIISNIILPATASVTLTTAIEITTGIGKIVRNIIMSGVISEGSSDELIDNYVADAQT